MATGRRGFSDKKTAGSPSFQFDKRIAKNDTLDGATMLQIFG
jgi:hypothetical protein